MDRVVVASILGALATNCSATPDDMAAKSFVDPAAYLYHTCPQLAVSRTEVDGRRIELEQLIAQAERGAGGALVSSLVYRTQHTEAVGRLKLIDDAVRERNCGASTGAPGAAAAHSR